ncbi:MAG: GNAT family N-acetyltransferase [Actinomycetota bacterium]|nr:GNAT family N-acetyltransferase [Actinomycetota bacterium]
MSAEADEEQTAALAATRAGAADPKDGEARSKRRRGAWVGLLLPLAGLVVIGVALHYVAPHLPSAQRADLASLKGLFPSHRGELRRGLGIDGLLIADYVLLGVGAFRFFRVTRHPRTTPAASDSGTATVGHPVGAYIMLGLVLAGAAADVAEDLILLNVVSRDGAEKGWVLGVMRGAGVAKLIFLAGALIALVMLVLTRERGLDPYLPGHSGARPTPDKDGKAPDWDPPVGGVDRLGVCLSGGGIRSAAFSLGGLQALQDAEVLGKAKYLAAASGGGYLAAGWALSDALREKDATMPAWSRGSPEERWFRDHSSYLVPDVKGGLRGVGRLLAGVAVNVVLIWLLLFVVARPVGWLTSVAHPELRAVQPVALPRDPKAEMAIGPTATAVAVIDAVVDGAPVRAQRYEVALVPSPPTASTTDPTPDQRANQVCFDTEPFHPSDRDDCFDVDQRTDRPITVEIRSGKAVIVSQPKVAAKRPPQCLPPAGLPPAASRPSQSEQCRLFDKLEVVRQPLVTLREATFTTVDRLPGQLRVTEQPLLRAKTGLVGRPHLHFGWWMWEGSIGPLAAAGLIGLVMMTFRIGEIGTSPIRGQARHEGGRFLATTLALVGVVCLAVTVVFPALILWLPTVGQNVSVTGSGLADYLLPSGGLFALALASARQFLSANRAGKGTGPAKPSKPDAPVGIFSRIWNALTKGREELGWYQLSPLKVLLGLLLLVTFMMVFVDQLQYASANGPAGRLMGVAFVRTYLPSWLWWPEYLRWLVLVGLLAGFAAAADAHSWSLYPFYKRALTSAYLVRTEAGESKSISYDEAIQLTCAKIEADHPTLVLCCAVNLSEYGMVPPGRRAASFTFGPDFIGGPLVGYRSADEFWNCLPPSRRRDITLPSAMAISGAAFSPAMGKTNLGAVGSVLAIANLRLGVWLPHPQRVTSGSVGKWAAFHRPGWPWFLREVTNSYKFKRRYLYVSDGGHWENLGLVELLRRGCTKIVCVSAAGDGVTGFGTISEAMALAREELGVEWINFDPSPIRPPIKVADPPPIRELRRPGDKDTAAPFAPKPYATGTYRFPGGILGTLTYIETALTKDMPFDVHGFAESEAIFPDDSTTDQVFNHRQFEAFRALGYHQVSAAFPPVVISFRPPREEDKEVARVIHQNAHRASPGAHLAGDDTAEDQAFEKAWSGGGVEVVLCGRQIVGYMVVNDNENRINVQHLLVEEDWQGLKIGPSMPEMLITRSTSRKVPVHVCILRDEGAVAMYERAGFTRLESTGNHVTLKWAPPPAAASPQPGGASRPA